MLLVGKPNPKCVRWLAAMAEVAELPGYVPGRAEISVPLDMMVGGEYAESIRPVGVKKG